MNAIQTFKLTKRFNGLIAVNGIDLEVQQGELFAFLGPNGAGKTTTINMLCCLLQPTEGTAQIMGHDITREPLEVKHLIGVSPQDTAISERLSCYENLSLVGKAHGMSRAELKRRSDELLEIMGLIERSKEPVGRFSGGMKRRLNLAMSLIHNPSLLFLDERPWVLTRSPDGFFGNISQPSKVRRLSC